MLKLNHLVASIGIFFISCGQGDDVKTKTLDFKDFTIDVPIKWQKEDVNGIDSRVGKIVIDPTDTISFDLGQYSSSLTELEPQVWERRTLKGWPKLDTTTLVIVEDHRLAKETDQYRRQNLLWDSINGLEVKIVYPRTAGNGTTGVYIDSLWSNKFGKDRFQLSGKNQKLLLRAIRTIKFRKQD